MRRTAPCSDRVEAGEAQAQGLVPAHHQVEALDRGAGGALHQVVEGAQSDHAAAVGVDGFFLEVHENPDEGKSDAANMLALETVPALLDAVQRIRAAIAS